MRRKIRRRLFIVAQNTLNSLLVPIFGIVVSLLVVRLASDELWGGFVAVMVVVQLASHIAGWGNKDYLLREFSRHPNDMASHWQTSLFTRLAFYAVICLSFMVIGSTLQRIGLMMLWGLALVIAQSYEVMVVYRKDFSFAIITEVIAVSVLVFAVFALNTQLTVNQLIAFFIVSSLLRAGLFTLRYRQLWQQVHVIIDAAHLKLAFPFFLLGFSGLLASRIDLYTVSVLLSEQEVGRYQVFINILLYLQALANFILLPYVKTVYRLPDDAILKISLRLFGFGVIVVSPALVIIYWLLKSVYGFAFSIAFMVLGGLFVLPLYAYLPYIYKLHKYDAQAVVLRVSLIGAGLNLLLNIALLPRIGLIGAVLSSALMQWAMLLLYIIEANVIGKTSPAMPDLSSTS